MPSEGLKFSFASANNLFFLAINTLAFLILTPLVVKNMGLTVYGLWTILLAISQLAGLATFSAGSSIEKFIAQYSQDSHASQFSSCATFGYLFMGGMGGVMMALFLLFKDWIAARLVVEGIPVGVISQAVALVSLALLPQFLLQVSRGILLGLVMNFWAGLLDSLQNIGMWTGILVLSSQNAGFNSFAVWLILLSWMNFFISMLVLAKPFHRRQFRFYLQPSLIKDILRQSFLTWFSSLGIMLFQLVDRILVGFLAGPAAAGVYSLATSAALRINLLVGQFTQVLTPLSSRWQAEGMVHEVGLVYRKVLKFSAWFVFILSGLLVIWMPEILAIWISPEFSRENSLVFQILFVIYSYISMVRPAHQVLTGLGKVEFPAVLFLGGGAATLAAIAVGAEEYGLMGAVAANLVYCSILLIHIPLIKLFNLRFLPLLLSLVFPLGMLGLIFLSVTIPPFPLPAQLVLSVLIFSIFVYLASRKKGRVDYFTNLYQPDR